MGKCQLNRMLADVLNFLTYSSVELNKFFMNYSFYMFLLCFEGN